MTARGKYTYTCPGCGSSVGLRAAPLQALWCYNPETHHRVSGKKMEFNPDLSTEKKEPKYGK